MDGFERWQIRLKELNLAHGVIWWPSRQEIHFTNKPKKSGSRWTLRKNIDRVPAAVRVGDRNAKVKNQLAEGWALSDPRLSNPSQYAKAVLLWSREELVSIKQSVPVSTHLSHTTNITLSKIKCERFRFCKKVYSFVIEVVHNRLMMFTHISVYLYMYTYSCTMGIQQ